MPLPSFAITLYEVFNFSKLANGFCFLAYLASACSWALIWAWSSACSCFSRCYRMVSVFLNSSAASLASFASISSAISAWAASVAASTSAAILPYEDFTECLMDCLIEEGFSPNPGTFCSSYLAVFGLSFNKPAKIAASGWVYPRAVFGCHASSWSQSLDLMEQTFYAAVELLTVQLKVASRCTL